MKNWKRNLSDIICGTMIIATVIFVIFMLVMLVKKFFVGIIATIVFAAFCGLVSWAWNYEDKIDNKK